MRFYQWYSHIRKFLLRNRGRAFLTDFFFLNNSTHFIHISWIIHSQVDSILAFVSKKVEKPVTSRAINFEYRFWTQWNTSLWKIVNYNANFVHPQFNKSLQIVTNDDDFWHCHVRGWSPKKSIKVAWTRFLLTGSIRTSTGLFHSQNPPISLEN